MYKFTSSNTTSFTVNKDSLSTIEQDYQNQSNNSILYSELKTFLENLTTDYDSIKDRFIGTDIYSLSFLKNSYPSNITQTITINKNNINDNLAELYESKINMFMVALKEYLESDVNDIGQLITESTLTANRVRRFEFNDANIPYVYYKVNVYIEPHTQYNKYVDVHIGPMIQYGFEEDNLCLTAKSTVKELITVSYENLSTIDKIYDNKMKSFVNYMKANTGLLMLGTTTNNSILKATTVRNFIVGNKRYYYRPNYTISSHNANSYTVTVTLGPIINWGDTTSITNAYDLGENNQISIVLNRANISDAPLLYLEKLKLIELTMQNFISVRLNEIITSTSLGSDTPGNFIVNGTKYYWLPVVEIPEHTADVSSIDITIGPGITYGFSPSVLSKSFTSPSELIQLLTITKSNIINMRSLYQESITSLKNKLQQHLQAIDTIKQTANRPIGITHTSSGQKVYYKTYYTIEEIEDNGTQIKVTIGPDIEWEYDPDVIELET